jgi:SAM-dependent methyltransferase
VNVDALWHDLECGEYREDLPLWRSLAARAGGPVLDVGAGTGRVSLDLASGGVEVVALDAEAALLAALAHRAGGLPVEIELADARSFEIARRFSLVLVPMQTLQLLGGPHGRAAFLRRALAHLEPAGLLAAAVADPLDCFDDVHALPPPPAARWVADVCYSSQLLAVTEDGGRAAIHRRREILEPSGCRSGEDVVIHLDRLSAADVAAEAAALGFVVEPSRQVPETDAFLGSAVAMLRAPLT